VRLAFAALSMSEKQNTVKKIGYYNNGDVCYLNSVHPHKGKAIP
jgi:ubiquitin C-terminal hydrolase